MSTNSGPMDQEAANLPLSTSKRPAPSFDTSSSDVSSSDASSSEKNDAKKAKIGASMYKQGRIREVDDEEAKKLIRELKVCFKKDEFNKIFKSDEAEAAIDAMISGFDIEGLRLLRRMIDEGIAVIKDKDNRSTLGFTDDRTLIGPQMYVKTIDVQLTNDKPNTKSTLALGKYRRIRERKPAVVVYVGKIVSHTKRGQERDDEHADNNGKSGAPLLGILMKGAFK